MKKNYKTMIVGVVASFVMFAGLILAMPKQAKAAPPDEYPKTVLITCPDGRSIYCFCDSPEVERECYEVFCGGTAVPGNPGEPAS